MRYQQVYNSSLFVNQDRGLIYISALQFFVTKGDVLWTVPKMQINLSTTSKTAGTLSPVFAENVGADDTVVFGPASYDFPGPSDPGSGRLLVLFNRLFVFHPPLGNLLLDVRILDGSGSLDMRLPQLFAWNSPTDECSRVWATNVTASTASGSDSVGLDTEIELSPVPSLASQFLPVYEGTQTNVIIISWPPLPTNFVLQVTDAIAPNAFWRPAQDPIFGSPNPVDGGWWIKLNANSAGSHAFYRLFWSGQ